MNDLLDLLRESDELLTRAKSRIDKAEELRLPEAMLQSFISATERFAEIDKILNKKKINLLEFLVRLLEMVGKTSFGDYTKRGEVKYFRYTILTNKRNVRVRIFPYLGIHGGTAKTLTLQELVDSKGGKTWSFFDFAQKAVEEIKSFVEQTPPRQEHERVEMERLLGEINSLKICAISH